MNPTAKVVLEGTQWAATVGEQTVHSATLSGLQKQIAANWGEETDITFVDEDLQRGAALAVQRSRVEEASATLRERSSDLVTALRQRKISVRDVATLLGVSVGSVQKLTKGD